MRGLQVSEMRASVKTGGVSAEKSNAAGGLRGVFSIIESELEQVRSLIKGNLSDCSEHVRELVSIASAGQGKMIRPGLVLLSGKTCGEVTEKHIRAAAIFEMIHDASLLHDDVIDDGQERRGAPTVNALRGNEPAVLLGDFLLAKANKMCVGLGDRIAEIIAEASMRTCEGELRQISQRGNWSLGEEEYIEIIAGKTAALFEGACATGAVLAGAEDSTVKALGAYGRNMGIAFQITDDLLDLVGEQERTGKAAGNDIDHDKLTLPLIHLLKKADKTEKEKAKRILSRQDGEAGRIELVKQLKVCGSIEYSMGRAKEFVDEAVSSLNSSVNNSGGKALTETARFIVGRTA